MFKAAKEKGCGIKQDLQEEKIAGKFSKKLKKEKNLYQSAYELFEIKGVQDTSIDDIVKRAGVAKGTFYLYFKNKHDIIEKIIIKKSSAILKEAIERTLIKGCSTFEDSIIYFIDNIIEHLKSNKRVLKIIHKNLSWGLYKKAISNYEQYEEVEEIKAVMKKIMQEKGLNEEQFEQDLFMIVELTGTVCYSAIIFEEPKDIDSMKPELFKMIKKMIK